MLALESDLNILALQGRGRLLDGVLSLATGALSITVGFLVDDPFISPYLFVYGGASAARGVATLSLNPDISGDHVEYGHLPYRNENEAAARIQFGENALQLHARRSRILRILSATISIASGIVVVPVYLAPADYKIDTFGAFVIIAAGVSTLTGLFNLFTQTDAERRWTSYRRLKRSLAAPRPAPEARTRLRFSVAWHQNSFGPVVLGQF